MNIFRPVLGTLLWFRIKTKIPFGRMGLLLFAFQCTAVMVFAQGTNIRGQVLDENNAPISGVTGQLKASAVAATTNESGNFSITVPGGKGVLVFSYVGYTSKEVSIAGENMVVTLQPLNNSLSEVVVVGYGTQRKVSVTGSVDKVTTEAIEGKPVANLSQALQGVSPNLIIQQTNFEPGQGLNINIRGIGTLGNNDPLVVIDGIVGGDINLLNPSDVESISILKDAGTAAIYGSRAANGVILITTK